MKSDQVLDIFSKLHLPLDKECLLTEVRSIHLNDGRIIIPNYLYNRFIIGKNSLGIVYGESHAIGGRFPFNFVCNQARDTLIFSNDTVIPDTPFYENLPFPKMGDIIRVSESVSQYQDCRIADVFHDSCNTHIKFFPGCSKLQPGSSKVAFYTDTGIDRNRCILGTIEEGIFLEFIPNELKKKKTFHEEILYKNIDDIRLSISGNIYKKEFSLKG